MKRAISAALALLLVTSISSANMSAVQTTSLIPEDSTIGVDGKTSNTTGCCWVYFWGYWWCVPCG